MKRTLIKSVSRIVTAQAGHCCGCRFPLEDKYGKYEDYRPHNNWELWHQEHTNPNFEYFLKCTGCGYELAKQYWKDSDGTFVDYLVDYHHDPKLSKRYLDLKKAHHEDNEELGGDEWDKRFPNLDKRWKNLRFGH